MPRYRCPKHEAKPDLSNTTSLLYSSPQGEAPTRRLEAGAMKRKRRVKLQETRGGSGHQTRATRATDGEVVHALR